MHRLQAYQVKNMGYMCDWCKKAMKKYVITTTFFYGSKYDGGTYQFCSDKCFKEFAWDLEKGA